MARAHGDTEVGRQVARTAEESPSFLIYWGQGRLTADHNLLSANQDTVFRLFPCPMHGLTYSSGSLVGARGNTEFQLDEFSSWVTLFPVQSRPPAR